MNQRRPGHRSARAQRIESSAFYGLDAESGFVGADEATSSQGPHLPFGGHPAPDPFGATPLLDDDFQGVAVLDFEGSARRVIAGELPTVWAGSGGGAGGDATRADAYPPPVLINSDQDKGAGGGGGAGAVTLNVAGDVVFGPAGRITAIGGHGSGGENTASVNRIGGGSGGGAGGHVLLHVGGTLDLSQVPVSSVAIDARGGEGGVGAANTGGADHVEAPDGRRDAKHVGFPTPPGVLPSNVDNPWIATLEQVCIDEADLIPGSSTQQWVVRGAGGDGGPGLVQLHVQNLAGPVATHSIRYPGTGSEAELAAVIRPRPFGYDGVAGEWMHHLLPAFGVVSRGRSKWIALGVPQAAPGSSVPDPLAFLFGAVDPGTGILLTSTDHVLDPPPILAPSSPVEAAGLPDVVAPHVVHFDATELAPEDEVLARNPALLREFVVVVGSGRHTVVDAETLATGSLLSVTVSGADPPLAGSGLAKLIPRYLRATTDGLPDYLPGANRIAVEFQTAGIGPQGLPDLSRIWPAPEVWETDLSAFDAYAENPDLRFLRFRVTFELESLLQSSRPALDFLRVPFRF